MLKFIFWTLLSINGLLFAYGQGLLGNFKGNEREPARLNRQLNADKLKLLGAAPPKVAAAAEPVAEVPAAAPAPVLATCTLVGNFPAAEARRFEALLAPLALGTRQTRENLTVPEVTSHIVFVPPQASKEAADRKAEELKNLGVSSYFVMNESSPMKWAISLGVFKSEAAAQTLLAALVKRGVTSAKIAGRTTQAPRMAYRLRDLDAAAKARVDSIVAGFPAQDARSCS